MTKNDTRLVEAGDLLQALGFLSRLPVPVADSGRKIAQTAWAWPLVGALLALIAGTAGLVAGLLGAPAGISAGVTLATSIALTGALHEDGLADTFDGLWGGFTPARRLEIMRDSRIGSYGVLALCLSLLMRWSALGALIGSGWFLAPLVASAMLSRAPMALLMAYVPAARETGLAAGAGAPPAPTAQLAVAIALGGGILLTGWGGVIAGLWATLAVGLLARAALRRIGGQTGDILGASQQLAELACLASLAAIVT